MNGPQRLYKGTVLILRNESSPKLVILVRSQSININCPHTEFPEKESKSNNSRVKKNEYHGKTGEYYVFATA